MITQEDNSRLSAATPSCGDFWSTMKGVNCGADEQATHGARLRPRANNHLVSETDREFPT